MRLVGWTIVASLVATDAGAQKLLLELRPQAGDTLHMHLEQVTELSSARAGGAPSSMTTTMHMYSRAIVESTAPIAALILAVTDSVVVVGDAPSARALDEQARRDMTGRKVRLRLWPDGTVTLNDGARSVPREVSDLVNVMPASFPSRPVGVGETWTREMPIPSGDQLGIPAGSSVHARFRLDSVTAGGDEAWISIAGSLQPAGNSSDAVGGSVSGVLVVDLERGWLSQSRFVLQLRSMVAQKTAAAKDDTTHFRVRVSQTMQVLKPTTGLRQR